MSDDMHSGGPAHVPAPPLPRRLDWRALENWRLIVIFLLSSSIGVGAVIGVADALLQAIVRPAELDGAGWTVVETIVLAPLGALVILAVRRIHQRLSGGNRSHGVDLSEVSSDEFVIATGWVIPYVLLSMAVAWAVVSLVTHFLGDGPTPVASLVAGIMVGVAGWAVLNQLLARYGRLRPDG